MVRECVDSRKDAKGAVACEILVRSWRLCVLSEAGVRTMSRIGMEWDWSHAKTRRTKKTGRWRLLPSQLPRKEPPLETGAGCRMLVAP
jgi:hypothetical protein